MTRIPYPARKALLDMQFNLGDKKLNAKDWNDLFDALNVEDYKSAASHSHRIGIAESRNTAVYNLFMEADRIKRQH